MIEVNIQEARTHLYRLLAKVIEGEEIVIARAGRPIAKIVPIARSITGRVPGSERGKITIAADFDTACDPQTFSSARVVLRVCRS
ncbi:MAG TPA: type II toxin-antitoxin system prevent-host-death family antitoxin [Thermoanaerobaculia bacterium]|nr:type II toxin-antitoxin system prevent-host-death family antitoxin [Thermoanaerobaculia bacterium]